MNFPQLNDRELLAKIFFPSQSGQVAFLPQDTHLSGCSAAIAFGNKPVLPGFQCSSFGYINNPDGTVRWLYPMGSRQARFLRLYSGAGLRSNTLRFGFKASFSLGLEKWARSGVLHVFHKSGQLFSGLSDQFPLGKMAVFTGTRGENQKAVSLLEDEKGKTWFHKQPLTEAAKDLVRNEQLVLSKLAGLGLRKMAVPVGQQLGSGLIVSDIKPAKAVSANDLQTLHFEALTELFGLTLEQQALAESVFWKETKQHIKALALQPIHPEFHVGTVQRVISNLQRLMDSFDEDQAVPTTLAHGDFTPWNMYLCYDKLHVFDWELSERLPMLYDAFHFIFQTGVLVKKTPNADIQSAVNSIKNHAGIKSILERHAANFELLYQFYLLRNISYYLLKYLNQETLHVQAHWQLRAWDAALLCV